MTFGNSCYNVCSGLLQRLPYEQFRTINGISWHFLIIYLIVVLWILAYSFWKKAHDATDPMHECFRDDSDVDGWSLLHFLLYFVLGFLFPGNLLLFTLIGIAWEIFEELPWICDKIWERSVSVEDIQFRAKGRLSDIAFNSVGLIMGEAISPWRNGRARTINLGCCRGGASGICTQIS